MGGTSVNPANATTYFFGPVVGLTLSTAITGCLMKSPVAGMITGAFFDFNASGTVGSNESFTMYLRINNTTDYTIASVGTADDLRRFLNEALAIPVNVGDTITGKFITPTWGTPPTTVRVIGGIQISVPG